MKKIIILVILILPFFVSGMQRHGDAGNASCSGLGMGAWAPDKISALANSLELTRRPEIEAGLSAVAATSRHTRAPSQPIIAVHHTEPSPELQGINKRHHADSPLPAALMTAYDGSSESVLVIPKNDENLLNGEQRSRSPVSTHTAHSHYSQQSKEIEDICERIEKLCIASPSPTTTNKLASFKKRFTETTQLVTDIMTKLEDPSVSISSLEKEISTASMSIRKLDNLPLPDEQEFLVLKQESKRLAAVLYRILQPTDISPATSPAKRRAASTVPSPLRPYTRHAQTNASHRAFQGAREGNLIAAALEKLRSLISDETLKHYDAHAIFACDISHVAEGHVLSGNTEKRTVEDIVAANARIHSPVYCERTTGIIYARNTDLNEAPLKTYFNNRITREDIGPLLKSLNNPAETTCLATQTKKIELLYSKTYGFTVSLIAHTRYNKDGIPSRVPTIYPIFSCIIISPHARHDDKVRIVDALELTRNEPFILDCTVSELSKIVISIREGDQELRKECCFESKDSDYMVVDIAPFLARQGNFPIKQGVFIKIPKTSLLTEELMRD